MLSVDAAGEISGDNIHTLILCLCINFHFPNLQTMLGKVVNAKGIKAALPLASEAMADVDKPNTLSEEGARDSLSEVITTEFV